MVLVPFQLHNPPLFSCHHGILCPSSFTILLHYPISDIMIFGVLPVTQSCDIIPLPTPWFWCPFSYTILHYPTSVTMVFGVLPVSQSCDIIPLPTPWFRCRFSYTILHYSPATMVLVSLQLRNPATLSNF